MSKARAIRPRKANTVTEKSNLGEEHIKRMASAIRINKIMDT